MSDNDKKEWLLYFLLALVGFLIIFIPDYTGGMVLKILEIDPNEKFELTIDLFTISGIKQVLFSRLLGIIMALPAILKSITKIVQWWWLRKVSNETKKYLMFIIDKLSDKEAPAKFFGKTYIRRGICPVIALAQNKREINREPEFLMLIRGLEEVRANTAGRTDPISCFSNLQEEDYARLFHAAEKSYYATSYKDHYVWVILNNDDMRFYVANWRRDDNLKILSKRRANRLKDWWSKKQGRSDAITAGIHRIFVLENNTEINPNVFTAFKAALRAFIAGEANPFDGLANTLGITATAPQAKQAGLRCNPAIQVLYILLAGKIHEKLKIEFSVLMHDKLTERQLEHLLLSKSDLDSKWAAMGWDRLGSAMIDGFMTGFADINKDYKTVIYYKFMPGNLELFKKEMLDLLSAPQFKGFASLHGPFKAFVNDVEFDSIAEKLTHRIKTMK